MGAWPRDKIRTALMSKGFSLSTDRDHDFLTFTAEGRTCAVFTKLSGEVKDKAAQIDLLIRVGTIQLTYLNNAQGALERAFEARSGRREDVDDISV